MGKSFLHRVALFLPKQMQLGIFSFVQDSNLFCANSKKVDELRKPDEYGLSSEMETVVADDNVRINLWHKEANSKELPVFVFYHGNKGHLGNVGVTLDHEDPEYRIKLLKEIEKTGSGYLAVSLRGFGGSQGSPSEEGFQRDVDAVIKALESKNIDHKKLIVIGESLGAAVAVNMAMKMTHINKPPTLLVTMAAFSSMAERVSDDLPKLKPEDIEKVLKHKFDNVKNVNLLSSEMHFYVAHPKDDSVTDLYHGKKLEEAALKAGVKVTHEKVEGGHINWSAKNLVNRSVEIFNKEMAAAASSTKDIAEQKKWREMSASVDRSNEPLNGK